MKTFCEQCQSFECQGRPCVMLQPDSSEMCGRLTHNDGPCCDECLEELRQAFDRRLESEIVSKMRSAANN